jgi:hypothetical protein
LVDIRFLRYNPFNKYVRGKNMPAYIDFQIDDYTLKVYPSEHWTKQTPFYNGTRIWLNLIITTSKNKHVNEDFSYQWALATHNNQKVIQEGEKTTYLSTKWRKANKNDAVLLSSSNNYTFTIYKAIMIEPILDFDTFDLILKVKEKQQVICQFTIQDIDEHGEQHGNLIFTAVISGIVAIVVSLLVAVIGKK